VVQFEILRRCAPQIDTVETLIYPQCHPEHLEMTNLATRELRHSLDCGAEKKRGA